eukprot:TRINITY_DN7098_c0_g1_i1.p1 TRINITY_DN7098_c0_g1~~TRINITY_DN7098_c0_g1_i1.p1  ORF type:complete len:229 (-),score=38.70 TRINITY_DN7098_c0_g1_i1:83-769(-)
MSKYCPKPFDCYTRSYKSSNTSFANSNETSFSRLSANNSFIRSKSIRKKLDNLISRCQIRSKSFKHRGYSSIRAENQREISKYNTVKTVERSTQTQAHSQNTGPNNRKGLSHFTKDTDFITFLKAISLYCQDVTHSKPPYKRLHTQLLAIKQLFKCYKDPNQLHECGESEEMGGVEGYRRTVCEELMSSPECWDLAESGEESVTGEEAGRSDGTVSYINDVYNKLFAR